MRLLLLEVFVVLLYISGILCQILSPFPDGVCPGDEVTLTCTVESLITTWRIITDGEIDTGCAVAFGGTRMCGPMNEFTTTRTSTEDNSTSTLIVRPVDDSLNGTQVECIDDVMPSEDICIVGPVMDPPQFLPAIISVTVNECVVTLEWNEPFISCAGSVSQYVLTVTPPTSDCQSGSGDCLLITNQTQYNLTVTVDQMYSLTVRADTCRNMQIGENSSVLTLELGAQQRGQDNCMYRLVYGSNVGIEEIITTWPRFDVLDIEADYIVVIDSGSGENITISDVTSFDCPMDMDYCTHIYRDPSANIPNSVSVFVETISCVTNTMICINEPSSSTRCRVRDLLCTDNSCDPEDQMSDDGTFTACSEDGNLCVMSNSERARYNFSVSYCLLNGSLERKCEEDILEWTGSIPFLIDVCDENLPVWNIVVMAISAIFFVIGVGIAGILGILLLLRVKSSVATIKKLAASKKALLAASVIITIISLGVWLGLIGYTASNEFCEESNGYIRGANSQCEPPSGDNAVKNALVIASFVFSVLVLIEWSVSAGLLKCGVDTDENTDKAPQKPRRSKKSKEADQELTTYDNLNHGNPPSSPQPLLSDSDPAYGKLNPDEEQQYSHIQREPKKPVYDPDDPNYSHFPKQEDQHYGKLDHGVKKQSTLPTSVVPPPSDSEYGKLDRSEMDSTPHYGKLDHGVRKGTTLPGTVIPPTGDEYGKLDRTQMEIVSAEPGGMYDVVTNEPRRKPPKALPKAPLGEGLYDPTAKPRKKPGH